MATRKLTLSEKEQAFVDALITPDWPTCADVEKQLGYSDGYGRQIKRKPHVQEAIAERIAEIRKSRDEDIEKLLATLHKRAMGEMLTKDPDKAAELFLEATGMLGRGTKIVTSVTQNAGEGSGFSDRLRSVAGSRVSADLTRDED